MEQIDVVRQDLPQVQTWARDLVVSNKEEYALAIEGAKAIKQKWTFWLSYWKPLKEKARSVHVDVCAKEKQGTDIFQPAYNLAKEKADDWLIAAERKAEEERRKLQAKADEDARRERERLEKQAANLKTPEKKEALLEQAAAIEAPIVNVEAPVEVDGVSVKKTWKARLVDMDKLIAAANPGSVAASFLEFNEKAANNFARSTSGKVTVPGIEYYQERTTSVKKGGENDGE